MASVYLGPAPATTLDSAEDLDLRWRSVKGQLADQGADTGILDAIEEVVAASSPYATEVAIFAAGGRVRLAQPIPGGVPADRARFAAPPDVAPLLRWLQHRPAYVVVVTDRTGAEVTSVPAGGMPAVTSTVLGPDDEIERNAPGGWSQPRYQRRAEDSWQHNAAAVADAVTRAVRTLHAGLLLVAGDVRAVQLLSEHLPAGVRHQVALRHLPGGRHPDGSAGARNAAVAAAVDAYVAEKLTARLARFDERGPGFTVEGVAPTLAALAAGRVGTLFVVDDPADERRARYGPADLCVAPGQQPPGGDRLASGRLVDVAVRAGLLTDAEVCLVDVGSSRLAEGIGGLCRFTPAG
jgi:hypothetical protein